MESLLVNLRKYRPRDNSDPLENFVTEAFAWLLRNFEQAAHCYLNFLVQQNPDKAFDLPTEQYKVSTQEYFDGKYPDLVMKFDELVLVFEHKVWSSLHDDQMANYQNYAKKHFEHYRTVLLTAEPSQHTQDADFSITWAQVYRELELLKASTEEEQLEWALTEFLQLLKSENLMPPAPVSYAGMLHYQEAMKVDSALNGLITGAVKNNWPLSAKEQWPSEINWSVRAMKKRWGRLGLEFCLTNEKGDPKWSPGFFIGFLLDGSDHLVDDLLEEGPLLTVIFDFNEAAQKQYPNLNSYSKLINELQQELLVSDSGWQLHNRLDSEHKVNRWHPALLTYPMLTLFSGTSETEEQKQRFEHKVLQAQELLMSCDSFESFLIDLNPAT